MNGSAESLCSRSTAFLAVLARELGVRHLEALARSTDQPAIEATRVTIADPSQPTESEVAELANGFNSRFAMVAFECHSLERQRAHPLLQIGSHLKGRIPTTWPVLSSPPHPDGTTKIRDIGRAGQVSRSLTNQAMAAHQDGWLSMRGKEPGILAVTGLCADSVGVASAATFSQNIVRLALDLWHSDERAFASLFADEAVTIVDRAGTIVAAGPVLAVTTRGRTQAFFRERNDEYDVRPGTNDAANAAAIEFLNAHASFGAAGSTFTYLDRPGRGLLLNNRHCIHGRTPFRDGDGPDQKRVIASKWWATDDEYQDLVWE